MLNQFREVLHYNAEKKTATITTNDNNNNKIFIFKPQS